MKGTPPRPCSEGLGKWFCECLSERPNWHPYPCQKWFISDANPNNPQQIYCPVGKVTVDYTDQPSFATVCSSCPGSNWRGPEGGGEGKGERGGGRDVTVHCTSPSSIHSCVTYHILY